MTLARKNTRAKLLATAAKRRVALSGAPRRSPPSGARRAGSRLMQAAFDKSTRQTVGQVHRAPNPIPLGLGNRHHFNAFGVQKPQALAFSVGSATHITGAKRLPIHVKAASDQTLFAFQPGSGHYQMIHMENTGGNNWVQVLIDSISSTGIVPGEVSASSPDTIMCSRGSLRLRNITTASDVGGIVHVLRVSTGLPNFWNDSTKVPDIASLIRESNDTVSMSASQLTETFQWDCIPVSQDKYHAFVAPDANLSRMIDPGLSTILILFEQMSKDQYYEISTAATYYARYRITGPLANSAMQPPVASLGLINRARDVAESIGSIGRVVSQVIGAVDRGGAIPGFLGNLVRQNLPLALTNA